LRSFDAQNKHGDKVAKLLPVCVALLVVAVVSVFVVAGVSVATLLYRASKRHRAEKKGGKNGRKTTTWPHKQLQMLHLHAWPDAASGLDCSSSCYSFRSSLIFPFSPLPFPHGKHPPSPSPVFSLP